MTRYSDVSKDDCTRQPQKWDRLRPYLPYIFRRTGDPELPEDSDRVKESDEKISLSLEYSSSLLQFFSKAMRCARNWERVLTHCNLPVPCFPNHSHPDYLTFHDLEEGLRKEARVDLMDRVVQEYLKLGYECRGYAQWAFRRFVAHSALGLGLAPPLFPVEDAHVGAVLRISDCGVGLQPLEELQRDGIPVFCIELHGCRTAANWNSQNPLPATHPGTARLNTVEVRRVYIGGSRTAYPVQWFVHPEDRNCQRPQFDCFSTIDSIIPLLLPTSNPELLYSPILESLLGLYGPGPLDEGDFLDSVLAKIPSVHNLIDFQTIDNPTLDSFQKLDIVGASVLPPYAQYQKPSHRHGVQNYVRSFLSVLSHSYDSDRYFRSTVKSDLSTMHHLHTSRHS